MLNRTITIKNATTRDEAGRAWAFAVYGVGLSNEGDVHLDLLDEGCALRAVVKWDEVRAESYVVVTCIHDGDYDAT